MKHEFRRELSGAEIRDQLCSLGVQQGSVLLVHASFRAVRPIAGGPLGLIEALRDVLGADGTLVMPSWSGEDDVPFDPMTSAASPDLGVTADLFWRQSGVLRSAHAFAFAAAGPKAKIITADPLPLPPHIPASPVGRVHELDGQVFLIGVGHDANTMLHLSELMAGVPYRRPKFCTVLQHGRPVRIDYLENDHCCDRFVQADDWLRAHSLQREGPVGYAHARLFSARELVSLALEQLERDPLLFVHPLDADCEQCNEARASIHYPGHNSRAEAGNSAKSPAKVE